MSLSREIIDEFNKAFKKARVSGEQEPTAMVLATSDGEGRVTSRTVLLKALDEDGWTARAAPADTTGGFEGQGNGKHEESANRARLQARSAPAPRRSVRRRC